MRFDLDRIGVIVRGLMALHNICIDARLRPGERSTARGWADVGSPSLHLQEYFIENKLIETCVPVELMARGRRRDLEQCARRELFTLKLKENQRVRPSYSKWGKASAGQRGVAAARSALVSA